MAEGDQNELERLKVAFNKVKDDPAARQKFIDDLSENGKSLLSTAVEFAESAAGTASETLEELTKEDLTIDKISELAKEGPDAVVEAIKKAGQFSLFTGGATGIATMLAQHGAGAIFKTLNAEPKQDNKIDWLAILTGETSAIDALKSKISDGFEMFNGFGKKIANIPGEIGDTIKGIYNTVLSSISSFMPSLQSIVGSFIPGLNINEMVNGSVLADAPQTPPQSQQSQQTEFVRGPASPDSSQPQFAAAHNNTGQESQVAEPAPTHAPTPPTADG